jgi:acetyl-CoA C-acetyltransferase
MASRSKGLFSNYDDVWLIDGVRTPFADYNTVLGQVSPIDLGIKGGARSLSKIGCLP